MKKIELINDYIKRCDEVAAKKDANAAKNLVSEIRSIFYTEIQGFMLGLNCQSFFNYGSQNIDWLSDIPRIKGKLLNLAATYEVKAVSAKAPGQTPVNVYNSAIAVTNNHIDIDIVINEAKNNIAESTFLSEAETKSALEKIDELLTIAKSKETKKGKWSKVANIFKWIADKSVDLAIAFAPTLLTVLESLH